MNNKIKDLAEYYAGSLLVPVEYRDNINNCAAAVDIANRLNIPPIMVMKNLDLSTGQLAFSSSFIIACINASGNYIGGLKYDISGSGDDMTCRAYAIPVDNPEELLFGPIVTIKMVKEEGWHTQPGSKWNTITELMIHYRSAAFFAKVYHPEILLEMKTSEELSDISANLSAKKEAVKAHTFQLLTKLKK